MFYDLFINLITLLGSILAGGLVIVAIGAVVIVAVIVIKAISLTLRFNVFGEKARKEMEGNEND